MACRLSVIIPTLGRPTLKRALYSALNQAGPLDEVIVVGDGPTPGAAWIKEELGADYRVRYFEHGPTRAWGAAQYDYGMDVAEGDWCMFLPDDDYMPEGAIEIVRAAIMGAPPAVHLFGCLMLHWGGRVLRNSKTVCEVTANQLVVPAPNSRGGLLEQVVTPERMPRWADSVQQVFDHAYLMAILKWYGQVDPIYHNEVICVADQANYGRPF